MKATTPRYYEQMAEQGNVYSQFGEDKVIQEVLSILKNEITLDKWACEFGAWDGLHLSNTANLIVNSGYSAVLIEADSSKFQSLKQNMQSYPVECINAYVNLEGANTLDILLTTTSIPLNFDLLSIDIDGADYWILESLQKFRPKIIVVEFNPTIPKEVEYINPRDVSITQGSSLRSLATLAESKNYKVVGITICNLILVEESYAAAFSERIVTLENLPDPAYITRIWQTYDGRIHTESELHLLWHDIRIPDDFIQVVPKIFLMFPDNMKKIRKLLFSCWKKNLKRRLNR